ncbi:MAG: MFS transporter [Candidatus Paceibacterota bacterium]
MNSNSSFKIYIALRFFSSLFFAMIVTVNLVYQATVANLNPLQLVLVGTLLEASCFLFEIPTGIVADLYSRKLSIIIGTFLVGVGFLIEGLFPLFFAILIAQFIWGIGSTFISGAREAWIVDEIGEKEAEKAFIRGQQFSQMGLFVGIFLSMLLGSINIQLPIILGGALYSIQSLFLMFFMKENNFSPTPFKKRETFKKMREIFFEGIVIIKKNYVLLFIIINSFIFGMFSEGFDRLWTPYLLNNFEFPLIGDLKPVVWFGIINIIATIFALVATEIVNIVKKDRASSLKILLFIDCLLIVSVFGFGFSNGFLVAIIFYSFISMFREARGPLYDIWMSQNIESKIRATIFSMRSQVDAFGQIIGGPIIGIVASVIAIRSGIVAGGIILVPTIFFYYYFLKRHKNI